MRTLKTENISLHFERNFTKIHHLEMNCHYYFLWNPRFGKTIALAQSNYIEFTFDLFFLFHFSSSDVIFYKHSNFIRHSVEEKHPILTNLKLAPAKITDPPASGPSGANKLLTNVIFHTANGCEEVEELLFKTHGACFSNILCEIYD